MTVTLTDVDEPPEITGRTVISYQENGTAPLESYTARDPESPNSAVTWLLPSGPDGGAFTVSDAGVLAFTAPPDFEDAQRQGDNQYEVTVRANDEGGLTGELDVIVTVTDVTNAVNVSFGDATYDVPEGGSVDVTVTLSGDPDQTVVIPLTAAGRGGLEDAEYGGVPANVTFSAGGSLEQTFTVTTTDDDDRRRRRVAASHVRLTTARERLDHDHLAVLGHGPHHRRRRRRRHAVEDFARHRRGQQRQLHGGADQRAHGGCHD